MSEMVERVARAMYGNLDQRGDALVKAQRAIEAMREPTEAMVQAARTSAPYDRDVTETWPLMIDEALK